MKCENITEIKIGTDTDKKLHAHLWRCFENDTQCSLATKTNFFRYLI